MHEPSKGVLLGIGLVLLGLLALSVMTSVLPLGPFRPFAGLVIAAVKAVLIGAVFMHIRYRDPLVRLFAMAGLMWLLILIGITLGDYLTRS